MKILIVYDSLYGNTEKIAGSIADVYTDQQVKLKYLKYFTLSDLADLDLLIAGSPTHGGRPSQGMKDFLSALPVGSLKNIKAAAFDTGIPVDEKKGFVRLVIRFLGYASKHIANALRKNGATVLAAETFFVLDKEGPLKEGEVERSKQWAGDLLKRKQ
ncbi:MAG: flavodoxin family protein [Lacibacter sp.]